MKNKVKKSQYSFVFSLGYITQKMAHFYLQGLVLLVLFMVISECGDISTVIAYQGEDVALPCFNFNGTDPKSCYRIRWMKSATDTRQIKVILARPKTPKIQDDERAKWEADGNGKMSLFLTKLQKSDEGLYNCEIWQECKVLQAVKAAPGTLVELNCPVDMTSGQQRTQNYSWVKLKGGNPESITSKNVEINGTSLFFQSVNYSDSGWYRCRDMFGQTQHCFEIRLQVQVDNAAVATTVPVPTTSEIIWKTMKEESSAAFIGAVAAVSVVIALIAALIGLFIYCRHSTQRVTQQTWRLSAGSHTEHTDDYEIIPPSEDPLQSQQVNCLYHFQEEGGFQH
uniref:uncharacterized protein LOC124065375 isoform X2 n=1 Tax=Scatophagus argus TaxID=75038 RepID=UPI001ED84EB4|nr:uncharacterized protein LOC124065375 isoform X2 [Scatophagus argus]